MLFQISATYALTVIFIILELMMLIYQLVYYFFRPKEMNRLWFVILLGLLIIYNIIGGSILNYHSSPNQFIYMMPYSSGFLITTYFTYYFYKVYNLKSIKFLALYGGALFLFMPYFVFFLGASSITKDLIKVVRISMVIPFFYSMFIAWRILTAIYLQLKEKPDVSKTYRFEILAVYLVAFPWVCLPLFAYLPITPLVKLLLTNAGFLLITMVFMVKSILNPIPEFEELKGVGKDKQLSFDQLVVQFGLTKRETEIALLLYQGITYKDIANTLFISEKTVDSHIQHIFAKTGVNKRIELLQKLGYGPTYQLNHKVTQKEHIGMTNLVFEKCIDQLLMSLSAITPLSPAYKQAIKQSNNVQPFDVNLPLLNPFSITNLSWYNVDTYVIVSEIGENGAEKVVRIVLPGQIFTDLQSFFKSEPSNLKFIPIKEGNILVMEKADYKELEIFDETREIVHSIMLSEQLRESWRAKIMALNDEDKVKEFVLIYPIDELPAFYCASFLNMTELRYSEELGRTTK